MAIGVLVKWLHCGRCRRTKGKPVERDTRTPQAKAAKERPTSTRKVLLGKRGAGKNRVVDQRLETGRATNS